MKNYKYVIQHMTGKYLIQTFTKGLVWTDDLREASKYTTHHATQSRINLLGISAYAKVRKVGFTMSNQIKLM